MTLLDDELCSFPHTESNDDAIVPYQNDDACPTDEALLDNWRRDCCRCFELWTMRVSTDPRYLTAIRTIQRRFKSADVDSLVQDVFFEFWGRKYETHNAKALFYTILFRAALRDSGGDRNVKLYYSDSLSDNGVEDTRLLIKEDGEYSEQLADCLDRLPEDAKELIKARFTNELNVSEIAEDLGVPYYTCSKRLYRLLKKLKTCIEQRSNQPI